jgi:hypothetical protein
MWWKMHRVSENMRKRQSSVSIFDSKSRVHTFHIEKCGVRRIVICVADKPEPLVGWKSMLSQTG